MTQATTRQQEPSIRAVSSTPASSTHHPASHTGVWPVMQAANQTSTQSAAPGMRAVSPASVLDGIYPALMIRPGRLPLAARVAVKGRVSFPLRGRLFSSSERLLTSLFPLNMISRFHLFFLRRLGRQMLIVLSCLLMGISMVVIIPLLAIRLFIRFLLGFWIILGRILLLLLFGRRVRRVLVLVLSGGLIMRLRAHWMLLHLRLGI